MTCDRLGREITVGCFIAYGHLLNRSAGIRLGRVEAVNEKPKGKSTITVLGINQDRDRVNKQPKLLEKRSTLLFPDRTIVLDTLPQELLDLYENNCLGRGSTHTWVITKQGKKCFKCGFKTGYLWD